MSHTKFPISIYERFQCKLLPYLDQNLIPFLNKIINFKKEAHLIKRSAHRWEKILFEIIPSCFFLILAFSFSFFQLQFTYSIIVVSDVQYSG